MYIYDGDSTLADVLGSFTGFETATPVQSTGADLYINFVSDETETLSGFSLQYEIGKNFVMSEG